MREIRVDSAAARHDFRSVLDDVERRDAHVTIERWKRPVAVLVPIEWYQRARLALGEADSGE